MANLDDVQGCSRPGRRQCRWCAEFFAVVIQPGRPKLYCTQSCRQRAYERRRGLGVLPPMDRLFMVNGGPFPNTVNARRGYECGIIGYGAVGREHALRPAGVSQGNGRRITMCGLLAWSTPRPFASISARACRTCTKVENLRPSARAIRPSADLAAIRARFDDVLVELSRPHLLQRDAALGLLYELTQVA